VLLNQFIYSAI